MGFKYSRFSSKQEKCPPRVETAADKVGRQTKKGGKTQVTLAALVAVERLALKSQDHRFFL